MASGLKSGALQNAIDNANANHVIFDLLFYHICAPDPSESDHAVALIFYEKDNEEDDRVTSKRLMLHTQFWAALYLPEKLTMTNKMNAAHFDQNLQMLMYVCCPPSFLSPGLLTEACTVC